MRSCPGRLLATIHLARRRSRGDDGMVTVEYAIGTLAAVAFAGVLFKIVTSDPVRNALAALMQRALQQ